LANLLLQGIAYSLMNILHYNIHLGPRQSQMHILLYIHYIHTSHDTHLPVRPTMNPLPDQDSSISSHRAWRGLL